jgi:CubicO group peptidase (beta-lactamase class C family)
MRVLFLIPLLTAQPASAAIPQAGLEKLIAAEAGGPGCAAVVIQDGRVVAEAASGLADLTTRRPMTLDTPVNIASMTKQFTGLAIALLIADGKLTESDDIRRYLPELKDYGRPIRIEHLLNHSSGLRNHMALAAFQPGNHLPSHAEALALVFRQSALNFDPGTRHQYESPNYVLLAEIVSRASGVPFQRFVATRILKPLGMTNSGFDLPTLAPAYAKRDSQWLANARTNKAMGSSGLQASPRDFAKWMLNYDRPTVGGEAARARMLSISTLGDGSPISYRYGLVKEFDYAGVKGLTRISHGGQTAAYRSAFSYFPGRGLGSVVACNHPADARAIDLAILSALVAPLVPPKPSQMGGSGTAPGMPVDLPARLAGLYYDAEDDDVAEFVVDDGSLALRAFGANYPLGFRGGGRFELPGEAEFDFTGDKLSAKFEGQARLSFTRLPAFERQAPNPFLGNYRSDDVDGPITISEDGKRLKLLYPAGSASLRQIGTDHFASPEEDFSSVRFVRGADGRVTGLALTTLSGLMRLRFRKS